MLFSSLSSCTLMNAVEKFMSCVLQRAVKIFSQIVSMCSLTPLDCSSVCRSAHSKYVRLGELRGWGKLNFANKFVLS